MNAATSLFERMAAAGRMAAAARPAAHGVQLRRTKGWKLPDHTISVARPGPFGNPVRAGGLWDGRYVVDAAMAADLFEQGIRAGDPRFPSAERIAMLRGWNLACWCGLDEPCHRNALLRAANPAPTSQAIFDSELHKNTSDNRRA